MLGLLRMASLATCWHSLGSATPACPVGPGDLASGHMVALQSHCRRHLSQHAHYLCICNPLHASRRLSAILALRQQPVPLGVVLKAQGALLLRAYFPDVPPGALLQTPAWRCAVDLATLLNSLQHSWEVGRSYAAGGSWYGADGWVGTAERAGEDCADLLLISGPHQTTPRAVW